MGRYLYGIHDVGGEHLMADRPGWIVVSEAIGSDPGDQSGRDYRHLSSRGFTVIVRLNNGYYPGGTIPAQGLYANFAGRCANFVKASQGCTHFIIGNEPNHLQEQPHGQAITPYMYAECFNRCYDRIKEVAPSAQVITAPIAPWDASTRFPGNENGDWVIYFAVMLQNIRRCDGIGLHTYTHGAGIQLITSSARMQPPFQHRRFEFRAYMDFLEAMPPDKVHLPVFITETDQVDPWANANTRWVQAAYAEINRHNQVGGTQKIKCLCLYRWQGDKWEFASKDGVQSDFRAAIQAGYTSPAGNTNDMPTTTLLPHVPNQAASELPRDIDPRLTERGVSIVTPQLAPGQRYWRVKAARWFSEQEAGGRHHIYVEAIDQNGQPIDAVPFEVFWPGDHAFGKTKAGRGFDAGNFPMSPSRNEFGVGIDTEYPTETLRGIGMGADTPDGFNAGIHTSTLVTFQLATVPQTLPGQTQTPPNIVSEGPQPAEATMFVTASSGLNLRAAPESGDVLIAIPYAAAVTVTGVSNVNGWLRASYNGHTGWLSAAYVSATQPPSTQLPVGIPDFTPPPAPTDNWARCIAFILRWEGLWADNPNDVGGATMKGITIGTFIRWRTSRGLPVPTKDDLRNITDAEVNQIYFEWYWLASGSDKLPWPLCLANFDTAVNAGTGRAQEMLDKSGGNFLAYMGHLISWYTRIDGFEHFGRAWIRRRAEILLEASK